MIIIVQRITDLNQVKSRSVYVDPRTHFLGEGASCIDCQWQTHDYTIFENLKTIFQGQRAYRCA